MDEVDDEVPRTAAQIVAEFTLDWAAHHKQRDRYGRVTDAMGPNDDGKHWVWSSKPDGAPRRSRVKRSPG